jgi:hypothetical protein
MQEAKLVLINCPPARPPPAAAGGQFRQFIFHLFDLWTKFSKIISKACPVGNGGFSSGFD